MGDEVSAGDEEQFPVTDVERDTALAALVRATGVGQLSLEEFDRRTDLVLTTSSRTEFAAATGGLEVIPPGRAKRRWFVPFGNRIVRGRFFMAERTSAFVVMAEIHLDLRGAVFLVPEPRLRVRALVGNLRVLVPSGVQVVVDQRSLFGGRRITTYGPPASASRPRLAISTLDVLGSVKVTNDEATWSPALMARG
jgi:predicted membrane protein